MLKFRLNCAALGRTLALLALLTECVSTRAELLRYDGFEYPAGQKLGEFASRTTWENGKTQFTISSGSLVYTGLKASTGNRVLGQPTAANIDSVRTVPGSWPEQSHGTLYVSFLLRLESDADLGRTGTGTSLFTIEHTSKRSQLFGVNLRHDGPIRLGVVKAPLDGTTASGMAFFTNGPGADLAANGSTTYLIVAKYEWQAGAADDAVTLWVNPTTLGAEEDRENQISVRTGTDGLQVASRLVLSRGPNISIDELRLGETWADVTPLDEPPRSVILIVTVLVVGLIVATFWITQLRRKVMERSAALRAQIAERQQVEQQRIVEQERARIAHDLHDELGADITEISMLATRAQSPATVPAEGHRCLTQMADKAHQMVAKLEEIVWAMNPQHDSLRALVGYYTFFADRFLGLANIRLTVDTSEEAANLAVEARVRHQLFLGFKEALANIVRHSGATEVRLVLRVENGKLRVEVADNGRGLQMPASTGGSHEGINSMRKRMEQLGGQFEIMGGPETGTTVRFTIRLDS